MEAERRFGGFRIRFLYSQGDRVGELPLVFLPGLAAPARSMAPTAELLVRERRVYVLDLPEHAERRRNDRALDLSQFAALTDDWAKALRIDRAVWVGHSFGAQVLVELALAQSELIDRLVLVSPTVYSGARTVTKQLARLLLDATREPPSLLKLLARDYVKAGGRRLLEIGRVAVADRVEEKLPSIQAPALVVRGGRDPLVPRRWAEHVASLLPNAQLVVIEAAPHAVQYTHPEALTHALRAFLGESSVSGGFEIPGGGH